MDLELLDRFFAERGEPQYRAGQVWRWAARGASTYDEMSDLANALRAGLGEAVPFSTLTVDRESR